MSLGVSLHLECASVLSHWVASLELPQLKKKELERLLAHKSIDLKTEYINILEASSKTWTLLLQRWFKPQRKTQHPVAQMLRESKHHLFSILIWSTKANSSWTFWDWSGSKLEGNILQSLLQSHCTNASGNPRVYKVNSKLLHQRQNSERRAPPAPPLSLLNHDGRLNPALFGPPELLACTDSPSEHKLRGGRGQHLLALVPFTRSTPRHYKPIQRWRNECPEKME